MNIKALEYVHTRLRLKRFIRGPGATIQSMVQRSMQSNRQTVTHRSVSTLAVMNKIDDTRGNGHAG